MPTTIYELFKLNMYAYEEYKKKLEKSFFFIAI